ncbi:sulfotransferase domain-containing protein [Aurantimonas sp. VKM B-3413]|uniref:sulfotransferase domain-containing protein n=1 Tax=Aurantimonas sp. VKM B-3413 TaxID=2779401 RepID=UPI001E3164A8|nr:sulfotransferase domain-containing protein [Aurantimonas sp. VKM B-3413]MCB8838665.1 sulfotransferase domain-containing protein [Aurantimonas sp. VKM B-3413]
MLRSVGRRDRRVDFLIAGTQKGGTTALDHYLRRNPSVQMPQTRKELHFFDDEGRLWSDPDYTEYHANFDWISEPILRGEATPSYMYWAPTVERIRAYNPDMKIICVLRHPAFRAHSQWRMERARGRETLQFSAAIREGRARIAPNPKLPGIHDYVERGFYHPQVSRLLENFRREQTLFVTSDFLKQYPLSALNKIAQFIGAEPFSNVTSKYIAPIDNQMPNDLAAADAAYLADLFRDDMVQTMELTGLDLTAWLDPDYTECEIGPAS